MTLELEGLYDSVVPPDEGMANEPNYRVVPIPGYSDYYVGKDQESHACLLIAVQQGARPSSPYRLEDIDIQFELRCTIARGLQVREAGVFSVIRCRSCESSVSRYFLSVAGALVQLLGESPTQEEIASAIAHVASMFQRLRTPPTRTVNGLFGELHLIRWAADPQAALASWRVNESARYDFSLGLIRLDVKTSAGRTRAHVFSYDQCNPPTSTIAVVASMFVERASRGTTLWEIVEQIESLAAGRADLIFKLHDVLATTLGRDLQEAMCVAFDMDLANSSLRWFDLRAIPGIRGELPENVSDVHFRSDLTATAAPDLAEWVGIEPQLECLLPSEV